MTLTIGFAVAAEHIRDFRPGAGHRPQLRPNFNSFSVSSAASAMQVFDLA